MARTAAQVPVRPLQDTLDWLRTPNCTCQHEWRSFGNLYGISMGKGWVRMTTARDCPHHKEEAS